VLTGSGDRSIASGVVPALVNSYEVIFKKGTDYFRGVGTNADGYISVSVPIDTGYTLLVLAGYGDTLLAAGYDNTDVDIQPNQLNSFVVPMTRIPPGWNGGTTLAANNDFTFTATIAAHVDPDVTISNRVVTVASNNTNFPATSEKLTIAFRTPLLTPLITVDADTTAATDVAIAGYKIELSPVETLKKTVINTIAFEPSTALAVSTIGSGQNLLPATVSFVNTPDLPTVAASLYLNFELYYYAFGNNAIPGGSTRWVIRNGIVPTQEDKDDTTNGNIGSLIRVNIGAGDPVPTPETQVGTSGL
jgi:hypothetical protein